jgi:hypothetical protein
MSGDELQYAYEMTVSATPEKASRKPAAKLEGRDWSELEVFKRLAYCFPSPAFLHLPQVRATTGFSRTKIRTADAIVASVYPSRGLWLAGIEIKVTKTDWRKELRDPDKSEDIRRFCKYWYVASPSGIVPEGEMPEDWGLIYVRADGAQIVKPASSTRCEPPDMGFVLSVLRTTSMCMVPIGEVNEKVEAAVQKAAAPAAKAALEGEQVDAILNRLRKIKGLVNNIEGKTDEALIEVALLRTENHGRTAVDSRAVDAAGVQGGPDEVSVGV